MSEEGKIYDPEKMSETRELLGGIAVAEWQEPKIVVSKSTGEEFAVGETLHIEIEPLGIPDADFVFHEWYPYTKIKNSKFGKFMEALKAVGVTLKSERDLVGKVFIWERKTLSFGEMQSRPTWMPIGLPEGTKMQRKTKTSETSQTLPSESAQVPEKSKRGRPSFNEYKKEKE